MYLYENPEHFQELIAATTEEYGITSDIIEKDCYVSATLQELNKAYDKLIFRGGTSLSKCFYIIKRFSEDIDVSVEDHLSQRQKKELKEAIFTAVKGLGLTIKNPDEIRSGLNYNRYVVGYQSLYTEGINPEIVIETYTGIRSYPNKPREVNNYIYQFLEKTGRKDIAERYQLTPFTMYVQDLRRTLIDKVFALCDYYLNGQTAKHSRHIYDIHMMLPDVSLDDELKHLIAEVRGLRKGERTCPSACDGVYINQILGEIVSSGCYARDYSDLTEKLLFVNVKYDQAIAGIQRIIAFNGF